MYIYIRHTVKYFKHTHKNVANTHTYMQLAIFCLVFEGWHIKVGAGLP